MFALRANLIIQIVGVPPGELRAGESYAAQVIGTNPYGTGSSVQDNPSPLIIDEIQRVPDLLSYLQGIVDVRPDSGRYILAGSQQFLLLNTVGQSLAGRIALFKLYPFTVTELLRSKVPAAA